MKYLGGKHLIGKKISNFISKQCPNNSVEGYLEPFCGSLGVFKYMTDKDYKKYIANDIHPDLIEMWKKIQKDSLILPKEITETSYHKYKALKSPNAMKAVAGFGMSFGGKFFAGFSQKWAGKSGRDFYKEFKISIAKIKPSIQRKNIKFSNKNYDRLNPKNMLIYCDPPYKNTEKYSKEKFDHDKFWNTMRKWSKNNCVFISEYKAPSDFKAVWTEKKRRTVDKQNNKFAQEKLFVYRGNNYTRKKSKKENSKKRRKTKKTR